MPRFYLLLVTALTLSADTRQRIARVEGGLRPGEHLVGTPETRWTIQERMAHHKVPAVTIAVINGREVEWAKAYGVIDSITSQPANTETLFQAASISKPVSALAALHDALPIFLINNDKQI